MTNYPHLRIDESVIIAMKIDFRPTFLKTRKPKRYSYTPRYYNREEENWEQRKKDVLLSKGKRSTQGIEPGFLTRRRQERRKTRADQNRRLILILAAVITITLFFLL